MSDERRGDAAQGRAASRADWKQVVWTALLVLSVGWVLAAGAILRTDERPSAREVASAPPPAVTPPAAPVPSIPEPASIPPPGLPVEPETAAPPDLLHARASADPARLAAGGEPFTLQLVVACNPENARRLLRAVGDRSSVYVLPVSDGGRTCWRVCWGRFASRAEAARAVLPAPIRSAVGKPAVKAVSEIVP